MMQSISELDFDSYLDVPSNVQQQHNQQIQLQQQQHQSHHHQSQQQQQQQQQMQQQQNHQRDILYHGSMSTDMTGRFQDINSYQPSERPRPARYTSGMSDFLFSDTSGFDMMGWDMDPHSHPDHHSPHSSPYTTNSDYTALSPVTSISPHFSGVGEMQSLDNLNSCEEATKALAGYQYNTTQNSNTLSSSSSSSNPKGSFSFTSLHALNGNVPGIAIPTTPATTDQAHNQVIHTHPSLSPSASTSSASLSPLMESHSPLTGAFMAMNPWGTDKAPAYTSDEHETRRWRTSKHSDDDHHRTRLEPGQQLKKVAHNAIERRYRNNINDRIRDLKNVVPALYKARIKEKGQDDDDEDDNSETEEIVDGVQVATKLNKATILRKATEYIQFLKHDNDQAERENQILQQIISQMPGGNHVLNRFRTQKSAYEKAEQERLCRERKEQIEHEREERQRLLRERAAQRAALAQLVPKPERRPYRRRKQKALPKKKEEEGTKMFMAMFMALAFFSTSPTTSTTPSTHAAHANARTFSAYTNTTTPTYRTLFGVTSNASDLWFTIRWALLAIGIFYTCVLPLWSHWLRPRRVLRGKKCSGHNHNHNHHHYASDVPQAWHHLFESFANLISLESASNTAQTTIGLIRDLIYITLPSFIQPRAKIGPKQLSRSGAWVRVAETECLGGNSETSYIHMLRSCVGMLANVKPLEISSQSSLYLRPRTIARIYATAAIQLELTLPAVLSEPLANHCWSRVVDAFEQAREVHDTKDSDEHWMTQATGIPEWPVSSNHKEILSMVQARSGLVGRQSAAVCQNIFYSFVLPYLTSPLEWIVYWQHLSSLQDSWIAQLQQNKSTLFKVSQLPPSTTTAVDQMLSWSIHLGLSLQSDELRSSASMVSLSESLKASSSGSQTVSHLLQRHRSMVFYTLQGAKLLERNDTEAALQSFALAQNDSRAGLDCIRHIATSNVEASVLALSTLAVTWHAFKILSRHPELKTTMVSVRDRLTRSLALSSGHLPGTIKRSVQASLLEN
ncbi:helix-loop-helix DNA-binding domain-containing transcription factor [Phycomyces blakesleeanus]